MCPGGGRLRSTATTTAVSSSTAIKAESSQRKALAGRRERRAATATKDRLASSGAHRGRVAASMLHLLTALSPTGPEGSPGSTVPGPGFLQPLLYSKIGAPAPAQKRT